MEPLPSILSCTTSLKIERPAAEVFERIRLNTHLSRYFATGGASGPLEEGVTVRWAFADYAEYGEFPVRVVKVEAPRLIHLQWESSVSDAWNDVRIEFEELAPDRTLVRVSESGWPPDGKGIRSCTENSAGWANMLACLKAYTEHGIELR